jgi:HEAT repeat protein
MFPRLPRIFQSAVVLILAASIAFARQETEPVLDGKKGSEWVDTLVNDSSARKRALAVEALAKLWTSKQYKESLPAIGRALRVDSSAAVRTQAAMALGLLKEEDIKQNVRDLIEALGTEKEPRVRKEIVVAIGRFPLVAKLAVTQMTDALKDKDAAVRAASAEAIAQTGSEGKSAAAGLVPLLQDPEKSVRQAAVAALGRISPEGSPAIAETMAKMLGSEKDGGVKSELCVSLGLLGEKSPGVTTALAGLLTDPDEELRRKAVRVLGSFALAAAPAADALLKTAATDKAKDIRSEAVHAFGSALGRAGTKARVSDLLALLKDPEFEVRLAVVEEVGALGPELKDDAATIKVLRGRLSDPHVKVREAASEALKKIEKKAEAKKE